MIRGVGIDLVEVRRIEHLMKEHAERFIERVFTPEEIQYCSSHRFPATHFAGRFAAKEALMKMLKTGWARGISWQDLEIHTGPRGVPHVTLAGAARDLAMQAGIDKIHLSISHTEEHAVAFAVGEAG